MALTTAERNSLVKNRVELVKNMYLSEEFFSYLLADRSLTEPMVEQIKVCCITFSVNCLCNIRKVYILKWFVVAF